MGRFFTSTRFIVILIFLSLCFGGVLGWLLKDLPNLRLTGFTYGFIAFSVLPITICLWGVKEFNSAFPNIAMDLDKVSRKEFEDIIDGRINAIITIAFLIVFLQIIFAFLLLYVQTSDNYEVVVLGILFGGILSSLIYGLYVCFSVRKLSRTLDEYLSKTISQKRVENYRKSFK